MGKPKLYLIDATAFCYRAFYAIRGLSTSFGQPTGAIYGFVNILNKILKEHKPDYLAVCFDVSRDTFRIKKFQEYKIQRPAMPAELSSQLPYIREIIQAYKISIFEQEGYEADDVIATLVKKASQKGLEITIVSADKDIMQLVTDNVKVLSPHKDEDMIYTADKVREYFGVNPPYILDIIALMGDAVDNIPGVKGIGEKTAVELIAKFGSLDNLLNNIDKIEREKLKELIKNNIKMIELSKELAKLNDEVPLEFNLEDLKLKEPDYEQLFRIFKSLEFKTLVKDLPPAREKKSFAFQELKDEEIKDKISRQIFISCFIDAGKIGGIFLSDDGKNIFKFKEPGSQIKTLLLDNSLQKIGYDLKALKFLFSKNGLELKGPYFDVKVVAYLINPAHSGLTLSELVWEYLQERLPEELEKPREIEVLSKLKPRLEKILLERELSDLYYNMEMPLIDVLSQMEINGINIDKDFLKALSRRTENKLIDLIDKIYQLSGTEFNINSPKQLAEVLFERLHLPVIKRAKTGPSTNEEVLVALSKQHALPALLLDYRRLMKLKNTYIDTLPDLLDPATGKIHTSFNQIGTETGRISSVNPNLQNIPIKSEEGKQIRKAFVASSQKNFLLSSDYSQIELRILAHFSKDPSLIKAFEQDKDIHRFTASLLYATDEDSVTDEMRETAKRINFGIIYGLSPFGLAQDLGIAQQEARNFIDEYFLRYPKVKEYINDQIQTARREGFVKTLLGRRRYIPEINNKNQAIRSFAERQAVNAPIQGSAADLIKLAMVNISKGLEKFKTKMILQIHDELLFDAPEEEIEVVVAMIKERMEGVLKLIVPIKVGIKKGKNWLEMEEVR
ncbi:MAG: DNA polymerase I [Candidatus Omnitrophica bacterium]|nr:DNA polymerase I [Candidatus Omnitrophota bacterium]